MGKIVYTTISSRPRQRDPQKVVAKKRKEKTGSDKGKLLPTDIGVVVTNFLLEHFPKDCRLQLYGRN